MPPLREIDPKAEQKTGRIKIKSSTPGKSLLQGEKQAGSQEKRGNMSRKSLKKKIQTDEEKNCHAEGRCINTI